MQSTVTAAAAAACVMLLIYYNTNVLKSSSRAAEYWNERMLDMGQWLTIFQERKCNLHVSVCPLAAGLIETLIFRFLGGSAEDRFAQPSSTWLRLTWMMFYAWIWVLTWLSGVWVLQDRASFTLFGVCLDTATDPSLLHVSPSWSMPWRSFAILFTWGTVYQASYTCQPPSPDRFHWPPHHSSLLHSSLIIHRLPTAQTFLILSQTTSLPHFYLM